MDADFYEIDGRKYTRVTRILETVRNPGLEQWRGRVGNTEANRKAKEANATGTAVHEAIERALKTGFLEPVKDSAEPEYKNCIRAFKEWQGTRQVVPLHLEKRVWSRHGFAGTVDLIEEGIITDWKTSGRISDSYWLQLNAYADLVRECLNLDIKKIRVVRLDKNLGTFEEVVRDVEPNLQTAFLNLFYFHRTWTNWVHTEEEDDWTSGGGSDLVTNSKKKANQPLDRPKVPDAGGRQDREVGFLEPW